MIAGGQGFPGSGPSSGSGGSNGGKLLQRLVAETQSRQPAPVIAPEPVGLGNLLRSYLSGQQTSGQQPRQRPIRRNWNGIVCFPCGKSGHSATRCPALDESFPFMLPVWRAETTPGGFIMISPRISNKIQPQNPGGGAPKIAAPRGVMIIEATSSPELSVGGPQSVPLRISMVFVEEAKAGGTPRLGCSRVDQDIWLLAGVAKPASVTVCEDSHGSPCVGEGGGRCPLPTLPGGSFRWYLLGYHSR